MITNTTTKRDLLIYGRERTFILIRDWLDCFLLKKKVKQI